MHRTIAPMTHSAATIGRRELLVVAATGATALGLGGIGAPMAHAVLPTVAPLAAGDPDRTLFTPDEQRYAPYLVILAEMANDITDEGFMAGGWWRTPNDPGNARIQEHVATLSWFLTHQRPWNPYYLCSALEARLDAAIGHYLDLQQSNGAFPVPNDPNSRATTGFGLVALASTYANLKAAGRLAARRSEIASALHLASNWFLNVSGQWTIPIDAVNQSVGGLVGVKMTIDLLPDAQLESDLEDRIDFLVAHGQSPAGFFYEGYGQDLGYNFDVMLPDLADLYRLTSRADLLTMMRSFAEWYGYNWVREPGGAGSILVGASTARTVTNYHNNVADDDDRAALTTTVIDDIPELAPFFTTSTDRAAVRAAWAAETTTVPGRVKGDTSPRLLLHAALGESYPSSTARDAEISTLPWQSAPLSEVRADPRGQNYVYLRRSGYYLTGYFGTLEKPMVKAGPNLLWLPQMGTLVHGRNDAAGRAWATTLADGTSSASSELEVSLVTDCLEYGRTDERITGVFNLTPSSLVHAVNVDGAATQTFPLVLKSSDIVTVGSTALTFGASLSTTASKFTIKRAGITAKFDFGQVLSIQVAPTSTTYFREASRTLHILTVAFTDALTTTVTDNS